MTDSLGPWLMPALRPLEQVSDDETRHGVLQWLPAELGVGIRYLRTGPPLPSERSTRPQSVVGEAGGAPPREGARRSLRLGGVCAAAEDAHVSLLRLG